MLLLSHEIELWKELLAVVHFHVFFHGRVQFDYARTESIHHKSWW